MPTWGRLVVLALVFLSLVTLAPTAAGEEQTHPSRPIPPHTLQAGQSNPPEPSRFSAASTEGSPIVDWLFDFGTDMSPVRPGWTRVTPDTEYSPESGYGWLAAVESLSAVDQERHNPLDRDFVSGLEQSTFRVRLPETGEAYEVWILVHNLISDVAPITLTLTSGGDSLSYRVYMPWQGRGGVYGSLSAVAGLPTTDYFYGFWGQAPYLDLAFSGAAGWQVNALAILRQSNPYDGQKDRAFEVAIANAHTAPAMTALPVMAVPTRFWERSPSQWNYEADWAYVKAWVDSLTTPDMTPDEKYRAVLADFRNFRAAHNWSNHPVEVLRQRGGYCTGLANLQVMAAWIVGLPARNIFITGDGGLDMAMAMASDPFNSAEGGNHEISEVYLDGEWRAIENNGNLYPAFDEFLAESAQRGTLKHGLAYAARTVFYHSFDGSRRWSSVYNPDTASLIYPNKPDHYYRLTTHDPRFPRSLRIGSLPFFDNGRPLKIVPGVGTLRKNFWLSNLGPDVRRVVTRIPFVDDYVGAPAVDDWYIRVNGVEYLLGRANRDWGANTGQMLEVEISLPDLLVGWNTLELGAHTVNQAEALLVNQTSYVSNLPTYLISGTEQISVTNTAWFLDIEYAPGVDIGIPDPAAALTVTWPDNTTALHWTMPVFQNAAGTAGHARSDNTAVLHWTIPGDDWDQGQAITYEVRYMETPIRPSTWASATLGAQGTYMQRAGGTHTAFVSGLEAERLYYFAVKSYDKVGNVSRLSENVSLQTPGESDLEARLHLSEARAIVGDVVAITAIVANHGPSVSEGGQFKLTLPAELRFFSTPAGCPSTDAVAVCALPTLTPGEVITYLAAAQIAGISGAATTGLAEVLLVTAGPLADPGLLNNSARATLQIMPSADLKLGQSIMPDPLLAGALLTYTLTITNAGPDDATNVVLTASLPSHLVLKAAQSDRLNCHPNLAAELICHLDALSAYQYAAVDFVLGVPPDYQGVLTYSASVFGGLPDPHLLDNAAENETAVLSQADVVVVNAGPAQELYVGDEITITLVINNMGPSVARNVVMSLEATAGITIRAVIATGWEHGVGEGVVQVTRTRLEAGESSDVYIVVQALQAAAEIIGVVIEAETFDPVEQDNVTQVVFNVREAPMSAALHEIYLPVLISSPTPATINSGQRLMRFR